MPGSPCEPLPRQDRLYKEYSQITISNPTTLPERFTDCQDPAIKGQVEEGSEAYDGRNCSMRSSHIRLTVILLPKVEYFIVTDVRAVSHSHTLI